MERRTFPWLVGLLAFGALAAVAWWWRRIPQTPPEVAVHPIPLSGGPESGEAEISGLTWFGDHLVLLPQYPELFPLEGRGALFSIRRGELEAYLDGERTDPVTASVVPLSAPGLADAFPGFDGFEAIAFAGDRVFVTVETRRDDAETVGWLVGGRVEGDLASVVLDPAHRARLPAQNELPNTAYEALVVHGDRLLVLYETNGEVNPRPQVLVFDHALSPLGALRIDPLEYRLTDATAVDEEGHFWVSNYHWPGAPWQPGVCSLTERYGEGESHQRCRTVERLVELRVTDDFVGPTRHPPILLELVDDAHARNWEGVVRLGDRGFLVMTDEHPESMLAFVPFDG
ncbi:MAG TPA: hypothetical protein RMH99_09005 [Sandaracinaceae bacterium LLY-WYZ-13_1]|nr:hypothetical protein [Sandaracinaceae bacterium LLY-WYZ-13_1]